MKACVICFYIMLIMQHLKRLANLTKLFLLLSEIGPYILEPPLQCSIPNLSPDDRRRVIYYSVLLA